MEKVWVIIARTHENGRTNPHSKKRIMRTVQALEADGYIVETKREIVHG